ncbi:MAG: alkaline phosphatase family protein [Chloroflexota bacterium]
MTSLKSRWARVALSLFALCSVILSASVAAASAGYIGIRGQPPIAPLNTKARYLVLIVLDGARPDYLHLVPLPHLDALMAQGTEYTRAMSGVLESETPTGHATISTGSTPRRSGILGFSWEQGSHTFSLFSPAVVRSGAMERIMQQAHAPTIAGLYKDRFPNAAVVALSGHKYYAADPLGGPRADAILYMRGTLQHTYAPTAIPGHVPPPGILNDPRLTVPLKKLTFGQDDSLVTQMELDAFAKLHQRITLMNYPDFDWPLGHVYGGNRDKKGVIALMRNFDYNLGRIEDAYRAAGILKQTLFIITADHGMSGINRFVPDTLFKNAVAQAGTIAPSMTFDTATYIWLQDLNKAGLVAANIVKAHDPGIQSVYYRAFVHNHLRYVRSPSNPIPASLAAANQFLLSTLVNGHEPTVVAILRKHATSSRPSSHWKADHGGATWGVQHVPLVIAGPGIRKGFKSALPAQLEDIAPTALVAMGAQPVGMEGHVLAEAMTTPFQADQVNRAGELKRISPVVRALITEDKVEGKG